MPELLSDAGAAAVRSPFPRLAGRPLRLRARLPRVPERPRRRARQGPARRGHTDVGGALVVPLPAPVRHPLGQPRGRDQPDLRHPRALRHPVRPRGPCGPRRDGREGGLRDDPRGVHGAPARGSAGPLRRRDPIRGRPTRGVVRRVDRSRAARQRDRDHHLGPWRGLGYRERGFGGHGQMFEEGLRVPLLVHATPGARRCARGTQGVAADRSWAAARLSSPTSTSSRPCSTPSTSPPRWSTPGRRSCERSPAIGGSTRSARLSGSATGAPTRFATTRTVGSSATWTSPRILPASTSSDAGIVRRSSAPRRSRRKRWPRPGRCPIREQRASGGLSDAERADLRAIGYGAETERR